MLVLNGFRKCRGKGREYLPCLAALCVCVCVCVCVVFAYPTDQFKVGMEWEDIVLESPLSASVWASVQ